MKRVLMYGQALMGLAVCWIYFIQEYKPGSIPTSWSPLVFFAFVLLLVFAVGVLFMSPDEQETSQDKRGDDTEKPSKRRRPHLRSRFARRK